MGKPRARNREVDAPHRLLEQGPVLGHLDGGELGADQFHSELLQRAVLGDGDRRVEGRLAAQGREHRVGALLLDDGREDLRGDRFDVGEVGEVRVRHDGGRVGVQQHYLVALFLERLARLGARVVELAGLADDDRSRADDEDFLDVCTFRHCNYLLL